MRETLKPCPFCGGCPVVERKGTNRQSCIIACTECAARLESNEVGYGYHWNLRASPATHTGELAVALELLAMVGCCGKPNGPKCELEECPITTSGVVAHTGDVGGLVEEMELALMNASGAPDGFVTVHANSLKGWLSALRAQGGGE